MSRKHKKKTAIYRNNAKKHSHIPNPNIKEELPPIEETSVQTATLEKKTDSPVKAAATDSKQKTILMKVAVAVLLASAICAGVIGWCIMTKDASTQTVAEPALSKFRIMLNSTIDSFVNEDGLGYALDENYYNEEAAMTYLGIITRKKVDDISDNDIEENIFRLFVTVKSDGAIKLIQKDNETLIWECEDRTLMNKLDYAFMGVTNKRVEEQSRGFYISQNDDKFLDYPYGNSNIKFSGCGPVSLTMALNYVNNREVVTLDQIVTWAKENNMYEDNSGTRWALMRTYPLAVSSGSREIYINSAEALEKAISEDSVLIVSMHKGHFTNDGHFMLITEVKDGKVTVLDPSSICRTLKKWDAETILEESNKYFWRINKMPVS